MGLDSVAIVIGWEEALGVSIENEEAETLTTPRLAVELLASKVGATDGNGPCLCMRACETVGAKEARQRRGNAVA